MRLPYFVPLNVQEISFVVNNCFKICLEQLIKFIPLFVREGGKVIAAQTTIRINLFLETRPD